MKKYSSAGKAKGAAAGKRKKVATTSHPLAKPLPEGEVLRDLMKGEWKVGKPIGSGGFGLLYLADRNSPATVANTAAYVVKVEPHTNGPLFCEIHFYQRAAKPDAITEWMSSHKLKSLGVPRFIATGQHDRDSSKYRFLVMERFSTDLQKLFEQCGKRFPTSTVFLLGLKLLDVLEYLHDKEYVHADIKASNLLVGYTNPQEVYLVDYGLAYRYMADGSQKPYKEDPKRTHDGTIEFTSRDAHRGVLSSPRADMEILGYCMLQWLCGRLPWEDNLENKEYVKDQKIRYMSDIPSLMKKCFPNAKDIPVTDLSAYLSHVVGLRYEERPDYRHCRALFTKALKSVSAKPTDKLNFSTSPAARKSTPKAGRKRSISNSSPPAKRRSRSPLAGSPEFPLELDTDENNFAAVPQKVLKVARRKPAAAAAKLPVAVAKSTSAVAKSASGMAKAPMDSAWLPKPVKKSSAMSVGSSDSGTEPQLKPAGARKQTMIVKRRRNNAISVATASTQTTPESRRQHQT